MSSDNNRKRKVDLQSHTLWQVLCARHMWLRSSAKYMPFCRHIDSICRSAPSRHNLPASSTSVPCRNLGRVASAILPPCATQSSMKDGRGRKAHRTWACRRNASEEVGSGQRVDQGREGWFYVTPRISETERARYAQGSAGRRMERRLPLLNVRFHALPRTYRCILLPSSPTIQNLCTIPSHVGPRLSPAARA